MISYAVRAVIIKPIQGVINVCKFIRHPLLGVADIAVKRRWYGVHDWLLRHHEDQHRIAALKCVESHVESHPDLWVHHDSFLSELQNRHNDVFVCEELGLLLQNDKWYTYSLMNYKTYKCVFAPQGWNDRLKNLFHDLKAAAKREKQRLEAEKLIEVSKRIVASVKESHEKRVLLSASVPVLEDTPWKEAKNLEAEFKPSRDECIETISKASVALLAVSKRDEGKAVQSRPSTGARNRVRKPMERRKKLHRVSMWD